MSCSTCPQKETCTEPCVGMGVTQVLTDGRERPYTVIAVGARSVIVQRDKVTQSATGKPKFSPCPPCSSATIRKGDDGTYRDGFGNRFDLNRRGYK